ncbi:MAG: tetratricopeptide repeat protein [Alphaproteobacteria bacterium]|nr:tetratricopeptide repeat protein [Alphaproteobacteria bacterium]
MKGVAVLELMEEGRQARRAGKKEEARAAFVRARDAAAAAGDSAGEAEAWCGLAQLAHDSGELASGADLYGRALPLFRGAGASERGAHTVRHIADVQREAGQFEEAERSYAEAMSIYRQNTEVSPLDIANALRGYALLKEAVGDTASARAMWEEAGELYQSFGVEAGVAESNKRIAQMAGK